MKLFIHTRTMSADLLVPKPLTCSSCICLSSLPLRKASRLDGDISNSWFCLHSYSISVGWLHSHSLCQAAETQRVSAVLRKVPFLIFPGSWNEALNLKITVLISPCVWGIRHGDKGNLIFSPQVKKGRRQIWEWMSFPGELEATLFLQMSSQWWDPSWEGNSFLPVYSGRIWVMQRGFAHSWAFLHSLQACPVACDVWRQYPSLYPKIALSVVELLAHEAQINISE